MRVFGFSLWTIAAARAAGFHLTMVVWALASLAITFAFWWYTDFAVLYLAFTLLTAHRVERRVAALWRVQRRRVVSDVPAH